MGKWKQSLMVAERALAPSAAPASSQLIATDGGAIANGKAACRASFAVVFGKDDPRNVSGRILQDPSNQKGELTAIAKAIDLVAQDDAVPRQHYTILTDSDYSIKCITTWARNWVRNEWQTSKGEPVKHRELIEPAYKRYLALQPHLSFKHIKSHRQAPADRMSQAYSEWYLNDLADKECSRVLKSEVPARPVATPTK